MYGSSWIFETYAIKVSKHGSEKKKHLCDGILVLTLNTYKWNLDVKWEMEVSNSRCWNVTWKIALACKEWLMKVMTVCIADLVCENKGMKCGMVERVKHSNLGSPTTWRNWQKERWFSTCVLSYKNSLYEQFKWNLTVCIIRASLYYNSFTLTKTVKMLREKLSWCMHHLEEKV